MSGTRPDSENRGDEPSDGPGWLRGPEWLLGQLFALMPRRCLLWLAVALGWFWFYVVRVRRRHALAHLAAALPEIDREERRRIVRRVMVGQVLNVLEMLAWRRLARAGGDVDWIETEGLERYRDARADGAGVLIVSAHLGNFDLVACQQALQRGPVFVISKRLAASGLNRVWMSTRRAMGVVPLHGPGGLSRALSALRDGHPVIVVLDQHAPERRAIEAPVLGVPARTTPLLGTLAVRSGAPVLPAFARRREDGTHRLEFEPPVDVPTDGPVRERIESTTRRALSRIDEAIVRSPAQWLWLHRRWKTEDGVPRIDPSSSSSRSALPREESGPSSAVSEG